MVLRLRQHNIGYTADGQQSTSASHSPFNISETVRYRGLVPIGNG